MKLIALLHGDNLYDKECIDLLRIEREKILDGSNINIKIDSEFFLTIDKLCIETKKENLAGHFENVMLMQQIGVHEVYEVYGIFVPGEHLTKLGVDKIIESYPYYKQFKPRVNRGATLTFDYIGTKHLEDELEEHKRAEEIPIELKQTNRGFDMFDFKDRYGLECSLQKSSLATEDCIWLGISVNRMHLTQDMVKELLPYLQKFVETGNLK